MSARTAIYDILVADGSVNGQVSGRVFMTKAPQETTVPFIVFRADLMEHTFTKSGASTLDTFSIEIDIYHNTIAEGETLGGYIRTALDAYTGTINSVAVDGCHIENEVQDFDVEEFPIWTQDYNLRIIR